MLYGQFIIEEYIKGLKSENDFTHKDDVYPEIPSLAILEYNECPSEIYYWRFSKQEQLMLTIYLHI